MWVPPDTRDAVVDFIQQWGEKTRLSASRLVGWLGIPRSKYQSWSLRYGKVNEHNGRVPRDFWIEPWERAAILRFWHEHPREGYRRLTYMLMDANVVAVSPATVYRVLQKAGALRKWNRTPSKKGTGFQQPTAAHEHWHIDISYLNLCGTFYYLCSILDGYSRFIVHWEIREHMTEADVEIILTRAREQCPGTHPRMISDNGPQFIARDFKEYIRLCGMTHVRTSPYYPQSNGKLERWHQSLKAECIRPKTPLSLEDARRLVADFVQHYNTVRLHSALGYVTPLAKREGREQALFAERDGKLETARQARQQRRLAPYSDSASVPGDPLSLEWRQPPTTQASTPSLRL